MKSQRRTDLWGQLSDWAGGGDASKSPGNMALRHLSGHSVRQRPTDRLWAGETVGERMLAALPKDLSLVLSTHVGWLTTACDPSTPFWLQRHPHTWYSLTDAHVYKLDFK